MIKYLTMARKRSITVSFCRQLPLYTLSLAFLSMGLLSGCKSTAVKSTQFFSSNQCGYNQPAFKLIDEAELSAIEKQTPFKQQSANTEDSQKESTEDKQEYNLVLVSTGQKPTSGYSLSLTDAKVKVSRGKATLEVTAHEPNKNYVQAQVITSPCIVVGIEKGNYKTLVYGEQELQVTPN